MMDFNLGDVKFRQTIAAPKDRGVSTADSFVLVKTNEMMEFYRKLKAAKPRFIMEIGMYEGGSLVWFERLYRPQKIVGVDRRRDPIQPLEDYRASNPNVVTYYARNQEAPGTLMAARENFRDGIDLVVDDASHHYDNTRATFLMLFPLMRAGGHYVIEDWSWAHRPGSQGEDSVWGDKPALTNLVFELTLLAATSRIVEEVVIMRDLVCIKKGRGVFRPDLMDFSASLRGRELKTI